jgi:23S rRNA pseudouridine955/2504/2580 synthase
MKELTVKPDQANLRLDRLVQEVCGVGFGLVQKLCRKGAIKLDGKKVKGNERLQAGQVIRLPDLYEAPEAENKAAEVRFSPAEVKMLKDAVLFEDDSLVVVNKPYGWPVQAGTGQNKSLDRLAIVAWPGVEPRLVHRLDRDTTGCLIFAKTREVATQLSRDFKEGDIQKIYWAVVQGHLADPSGEIDFALNKDRQSGHKEKMHVRDGEEGLAALTYYKRIDQRKDLHWLEVRPATGRTHQIRAHLSAIGTPILGDGKYGDSGNQRLSDGKRAKLFLHAREVHFNHPVTGKEKVVKAPMPEHFVALFEQMRWQA